MYKTVKIPAASDAAQALEELGPMLDFLWHGDLGVISSHPMTYSSIVEIAINDLFSETCERLIKVRGSGWRKQLEKAMHPFSEK